MLQGKEIKRGMGVGPLWLEMTSLFFFFFLVRTLDEKLTDESFPRANHWGVLSTGLNLLAFAHVIIGGALRVKGGSSAQDGRDGRFFCLG